MRIFGRAAWALIKRIVADWWDAFCEWLKDLVEPKKAPPPSPSPATPPNGPGSNEDEVDKSLGEYGGN